VEYEGRQMNKIRKKPKYLTVCFSMDIPQRKTRKIVWTVYTGEKGGVGLEVRQTAWTKICEIVNSIRELLSVLNRDYKISSTSMHKILNCKKIHTEMAVKDAPEFM
jgi:hypothetical protein